ncbi:Fpg/Nei family DNA glycosylase [Paenibacillus rigui]|uniref:Endonuclease VIII n=1 Tax=Paenibacillus rigui TaxID=554312 RepID=A0A229UWQ6_9BACL|nr:DNA-formamidopyrimidine glycosylase family protein [Paenibacillus rigui]OXM87902.1 endonuclease VIII [Paenibacillus rigui]
MPELPEMENYKLLLGTRLNGHTITMVEVTREKSINVPVEQFQQALLGNSIRYIERRGKHLLFHLSNSKLLLLHLMLGGVLFCGTEEQKPDRTVQVTLRFGNMLLYCIGLRLGYIHLYEHPESAAQVLQKLGPEPMEPGFTLNHFKGAIGKQRGTLKATLVDQHVMAGIGNCYSDEICFDAGLLPERRCAELSAIEVDQLYRSMRHVLSEAIRYGGYMDMPLYAGDVLTGGYDSRCQVYDREGESCYRCGHLIMRNEVSSKKSFCCPNCQQ